MVDPRCAPSSSESSLECDEPVGIASRIVGGDAGWSVARWSGGTCTAVEDVTCCATRSHQHLQPRIYHQLSPQNAHPLQHCYALRPDQVAWKHPNRECRQMDSGTCTAVEDVTCCGNKISPGSATSDIPSTTTSEFAPVITLLCPSSWSVAMETPKPSITIRLSSSPTVVPGTGTCCGCNGTGFRVQTQQCISDTSQILVRALCACVVAILYEPHYLIE